ncbi:hypothetical protein DPMN_150697 [Dreissena polymorpha]|uniref:Uncharacterized protein n=1 Tax=Dreissena polymorpha TaxID=45954 RepID=A0A9D4J6K4_DREPO|nr:hypothetical protein DPMN_150697 [Dreissena polymorpha]
MDKYDYASFKFQDIIVVGFREALSNEQAGIHLTLSHFRVREFNLMDVYNILTDNTSNIQVLNVDLEMNRYIHSSPAHIESTSHVEFDLTSCP